MTQAIMYKLQSIRPGTCGHCKMMSVSAVGWRGASSGSLRGRAPWSVPSLGHSCLCYFPQTQSLFRGQLPPSLLPCCLHLSLFPSNPSNVTLCCVAIVTMGQQFEECHRAAEREDDTTGCSGPGHSSHLGCQTGFFPLYGRGN